MVRFCDDLPFALGWIADDTDRLERCSHALRAGDRVWIVDALEADGVDERIRALGRPAGVIQLLDRHSRDCRSFADRFGVPLHEVPDDSPPGSVFELIPIRRGRFWREAALWWPERRVLVCADALATARGYRAPGERLAVHPLLRLRPPRQLGGLDVQHLLSGHGEGLHGPEAAAVLSEALATARRRMPRYLVGAVRFHVLERNRPRPNEP